MAGICFKIHTKTKNEKMELHGQVLVLNQDYQPLTVCGVKRAVMLTFMGKAELLHRNPELKIRSVTQSYDYPTVVRLLSYIRVPYNNIVVTRRNILKRDGYRCQYCNAREDLTIDHVIPRSRGGRDTWKNLVTSCASCNIKKGNRTPREASMKLLKKPYKPNHILYLQTIVASVKEDWKPYLYM